MVPNNRDPFPEVYIFPDFKGADGEVLKNSEDLTINEANSKKLYRSCVKVLNLKILKERVDTVWRDKLGLDQSIKPVWRVFYKPPLEKRWRILHGAVAVNSFVNVINPSVLFVKKETISHCFMECTRLCYLFDFLALLFGKLNVFLFFYGSEFYSWVSLYSKKNKIKCQLLNFIVGEVKMVVYKQEE